MTFHHSDERTRDTDNQVSSVLDLLKGIKVIKDDNWKIVRRISAEAVKDKESFVMIAISVI
jgi:Holliday junction resolvase RusA-like endonuclease